MSVQLGVIGAGNMGLAIVRGAIDAGVLGPEQLLVCEIDPARREQAAALGCSTSADPTPAAEADQILLAVKPQGFPVVAEALAPLARPTVVISIMAGLGSGHIRAALGERARVVRVMPNTPCQIGQGMAAIAVGEGAGPADAGLAERIFGAVGRTTMVDESLMYAVTAVSGGGPAYLFLLAEMMQRGAVEIGIDEPTASLLVNQTILGAAKLLNESDESPAALRKAVTSPGGTTAEALNVLFDSGWPDQMVRALAAARDRGIELDQG